MIVAPILIGFLSAIGWWGGNKVTAAIDAPPSIQCEVKK